MFLSLTGFTFDVSAFEVGSRADIVECYLFFHSSIMIREALKRSPMMEITSGQEKGLTGLREIPL
ncbi:MAG: hypothetical protein GXX85_02125 [Ignavibacteria bacterium]|nr:hypothetical protein [Ignavibacteria bacterium]